MPRGSRTLTATLAILLIAGCPGPYIDLPRADPSPRYSPPPAAPASPQPNRSEPRQAARPPSLSPPMPSDSLGANAAPTVVAASHLTDQARRMLEAGDNDRALELLEQALQIDSTAPFAYYYLAVAYLRRERPAEALVLAERATTLSRGYAVEWTAHSRVLAGHALERLGKPSEARSAYEQALALAPDTIPALKALERLER